MEIWKSIPGFPDYEVSDRGRVRSWRRMGIWAGKVRRETCRVLSPRTDGIGRLTVNPCVGGQSHSRPIRVHRLVMTRLFTFCLTLFLADKECATV